MLSFGLLSCNRHEHRFIERLAVLPLENLTGDSSLDWAGLAVTSMFASEIAASTHLSIFEVARAGDATLERANQLFQGYFDRRDGRLRFFGVLRDLATGRALKTFDSTVDLSDLATASDAMAHQLGDRLRPFPTRNPDAIRAWGQALAASDRDARAASLEKAIEADPNFGTPYAQLAALYSSTGQKAEAAAVIEKARPHFANLGDVDRARVELVDADLRANAGERRQALIALSRLFSTDVDTLRKLGEANLVQHDFQAAADAFRNAAAISPEDAVIWNSLGYAESYAGKLDAARTALERYRDLQPEQWNPYDSLGEVNFFLGSFEEAEKQFLESAKRAQNLAPVEFLKTAQARLMRGDVAAADTLFSKSLGAASSGPAGTVRQAQWLFLTGRRSQAYSAITPITATPGIGVYANAQTGVWFQVDGQRDRAHDSFVRCSEGAPDAPLGSICKMLADPSSPVPPGLADASIYRPVLGGNFAAALPELKRLYEKSRPGSDSEVRILYAWALIETGHVADAAPLLALYPIPASNGELLFAPLIFPRYLALRATVLRTQGKNSEADAADALYRKFSAQ